MSTQLWVMQTSKERPHLEYQKPNVILGDKKQFLELVPDKIKRMDRILWIFLRYLLK